MGFLQVDKASGLFRGLYSSQERDSKSIQVNYTVVSTCCYATSSSKLVSPPPFLPPFPSPLSLSPVEAISLFIFCTVFLNCLSCMESCMHACYTRVLFHFSKRAKFYWWFDVQIKTLCCIGKRCKDTVSAKSNQYTL